MTKFYRISLSGFGGEFIFLEISKGAHDFWKEQSEEDLVEYCLYPEDQTVKAEADFLYNAATGRHDQRYDADDVQTIVGISADTKCYLNVSEVSDGTNDARELKRKIKNKVIKSSNKNILVEKFSGKLPTYAVQFADILKGRFYDYTIEMEEEFDVQKLEFYAEKSIDGEMFISGIDYDGAELVEEWDADTDGSGTLARVFKAKKLFGVF